MHQNILYSQYQAENPERFNEDLIYIRHKEDVDSYFRDLFTTLNSIPGITFLDMERVGEEKCAEYIQKRTASTPNLSICSNGSTILPIDLDIFFPSLSSKCPRQITFLYGAPRSMSTPTASSV